MPTRSRTKATTQAASPAAPAEPAPLLTVDRVGYTYGSYRALDAIDLRVRPGEIVALAGRNGSGKSTLMRCIAGWSRASEGSITIGGIEVANHEREVRQQLTFVPDVPTFFDDLTAWEHVAFLSRMHGRQDWETGAETTLQRMGLWQQRDAFPLAFSRGMQYKLAVSMAFVVDPPLLVLDEPFGPLDAVSAGRLWDDLVDRKSPERAVLLSSHQLPYGVEPDRFVLLEQGAILAQGTPDELCERFDLEEPAVDAILEAALDAADARR